MSRVDQLTGKRAKVVHSRSHSNIATKRWQSVNLQVIRVNGQRIRVSARTMRTLKKMAKMQAGELPTKRQKKAAKKAAMAQTKA